MGGGVGGWEGGGVGGGGRGVDIVSMRHLPSHSRRSTAKDNSSTRVKSCCRFVD